MTPSISVVVPAYNAAPWIGGTIESVLAQDWRGPLEVVVIDDGSSDGTAAGAEAVLAAGGLPFRILSIANGGPSGARNAGWRQASGEWIQFLDADDLLGPGKLALQAGLAAQADPSIAVLYSEWQRLALNAGRWEPEGPVIFPRLGDADPLTDLMRTENFLHVGSLLIRRSWLERVAGFDESQWLIEDVNLMLRLAMAGARFLRAAGGRPLSFYRQRPADSLSQRDVGEFVEGCMRNARIVEDFWRSRAELTPARAHMLAAVYLQGVRHFAPDDRSGFHRSMTWLEGVSDGYAAPGSRGLRVLRRVLGMRRAEWMAAVYRRRRSR